MSLITVPKSEPDREITFILNGARVHVRDLAPTTTLLDYLRQHRRLTGTKEGCAEGDCGACTVAVGSLGSDGAVVWRPLNACILFLPMLHGKAVITVEALAGPQGQLHPAQQAIVDHHGTQCGFCTPGFVMSLYVDQLNRAAGRHLAPATDMLAGNLCRCTGYGPLIDAAQGLREQALPDWDPSQTTADELNGLAAAASQNVSLSRNGHTWFIPPDLETAAHLYAENPSATIVAGATDVGLWVTKQLRILPTVIALTDVPELKRIAVTSETIEIGAAVTYAEAQDKLAELAPDLGELVRRIGALQVRSAGTIGGNIANGSPIGDTAPALIALGAELVLRSAKAQRRIPLDAFFLAYGEQDRAPGELIEAIIVPRPADPTAVRCYKISKRLDQDISAVCGCFHVTVGADDIISSARIAFGGMAGIPKRARSVEDCLVGARWSHDTIETGARRFADDFTPLSDMRGSAEYRLLTAQNLLRKYFIERINPAAMTRITEVYCATHTPNAPSVEAA